MPFPDSPSSLLQELIRIPSVNPDSAAEEDAAGEAKCAAQVGEWLEELGAAVTFDEVLPGRPNVIGRFPGRQERPSILFAPHTDTVSVQGMTIDPFAGEIRDGRIYGRGSSDTKGTMAAMLWALHELRDELGDLLVSVAFVGLMGEEAAQPGAIHFARHHATEFDFAIVGEPTELKTVFATKGCVWHRLSTRGRSCHGSTPEQGENAIRKMIPALQRVLAELEARFTAFADPVLGEPTVSLGTLNGGSSPNIVPAHCEAFLDIRETPALDEFGGSIRLIREVLEAEGWGDRVLVETRGTSKPLFTDPEHDGIRRLLSIGSELTIAPWYCDAGRLAEGGLAAVACGPGSIAQAHTKDEYLAISDLEAGAEFYRRFIETYRA